MSSQIKRGGELIRPSWNYRKGGYSAWVDYETHSLEMMESCRNVMEDVAHELRALNALLHCHKFMNIPSKLDAIKKNTTKRKYVRKSKETV